MRELFTFPNPVNDVAARTVAAGVFVMAGLAAGGSWLWLTVPLAYGFVARVLTGPRLSPLALVATRVVAPRVARHPRFVPGPPKRFAQGIGAAFSLTTLALWLVGEPTAARIVLAEICVPALLEAGLGLCVGCRLFSMGIRLGMIPERVCLECADLPSHWRLREEANG